MVIQFRGGSESAWLSSLFIPADRQLVMARRDDGTVRAKFGDGVHRYVDLPDLYNSGSSSNGGSEVLSFTQSSPLATWIIDHNLGRLPSVQIYVDEKQVDTDIDATNTQVILTFPSPTSGVAVIS